MEPYLGQIMLFGGNFVIRDWAACDGSLIQISANSALFSLLGTTYGGNGVQTFALPDLRGRAVIGYGAGPGLSPRELGEKAGGESTTLLIPNLPAHNHLINVNNGPSTTGVPDSTVLLSSGPTTGGGPSAKTETIYSNKAGNATLSATSVSVVGGSQPVSVMQPYLALNYQIAMYGVFPSRS